MGDKVTTSQSDWLTQVVKADPDHYKRDVVYEFSNGRQFLDDDNTDNGVYDGT